MVNPELILTLTASLAAAFKFTSEYSERLKFEKNKLLLDEINKHQSLNSTKVIEKILDFDNISLELNGRVIHISNELLFNSLQTHDIKQTYSDDEVLIRDLFDEYFDNLTKLLFMSKSQLVQRNNLNMFMRYWFDILSGKSNNKPDKVIQQIHTYLEFYGFIELRKFLTKK